MATGRNWLLTLWPASFKGVPFQVEHDDEDGGRRIVKHEFPMRDEPFLEDLGEKVREFDVTAYVASDAADTEAAALMVICTQRGAGVLVLPTQGPILARCETVKRNREKDKAGKIAFSIKFVREGAASALVSVLSLANLVFSSADGVAAAIAIFILASVKTTGYPDYVSDAATSAVQDGAAILEVLRTTNPVDPLVSAVQRDAIQVLYNRTPAAFTRAAGVDASAVSDLVGIARGLGAGMTGEISVKAFEPVAGAAASAPDTYALSDNAKQADQNKRAIYIAIQLVALTAYVEGVVNMTIPDRPTAIALRANLAEWFDDMVNSLSVDDVEIYRAAIDLRSKAIDYLSRVIINRAPVLTVEANVRLPSLWWAHRLYADASRASDIISRNDVLYPSFMPTAFEALAR